MKKNSNLFLTLRGSGRIAFASGSLAVTLYLRGLVTSVFCVIFRRVWEARVRFAERTLPGAWKPWKSGYLWAAPGHIHGGVVPASRDSSSI
jgi:hypothetical protein